jgi:hypothetical protein
MAPVIEYAHHWKRTNGMRVSSGINRKLRSFIEGIL